MKKNPAMKDQMKKEKKLMDAITDVPDEMIEEAEKKGGPLPGSEKSPGKILRYAPAFAACLLLAAAGILSLSRARLSKSPVENPRLEAARPLMEVSMPPARQFDDRDTTMKTWEENPVEESFTDSLSNFSYETASALFAGGNENINYSPVSLYYALAMAATGAEGETKDQLLSLLGVQDTETLKEQCGNYYRRSYTENEISTQRISNSLWLDVSVGWKQSFVENAAENFYSSIFSMELGTEEAAQAMSAWIEEQTDGSLSPRLPSGGEAALNLVNTVSFHDQWLDQFDEAKTKPDSFYPSGASPVTCDFMNRTYDSHGFSVGEGYTRSSLSLKNGTMVFILPDEGISPRSLVDTPEKMRETFEGGKDYCGEVVWQIPKFDFSSNLQLGDTLKALGITSAFEETADFSGITDDTVFFSGITQGTHIAVNEEGVDASAFTLIEYAGAAQPAGRADMRLTRPFLYGITGTGGGLVFIGICENPAG